ncbi:pilus assembly protein [Shinella daejeonensis]|uniref:TadE/TadG family type IV pilus assembly protein n=1 Tax=Shinella daejeonensis TaxID=659017 RepID=UPI0020C7C830|nr:TadE/TadG family type IV pilus assembly protein [Shinella daejeonensis]MCP8893613.1 pilus assembly protein [Shinella daejeonensis]
MHALSRLMKERSGTSALEFAIVAPLFFLALFTLIAYGVYLSVTHSVQQIAADAARTAVAGLDAGERVQLVNRYLDASGFDYSFIDRRKMQVTVAEDPNNPDQFTVRIAYDSGDLPIWNLFTFALPQERIERYATIRIGGI